MVAPSAARISRASAAWSPESDEVGGAGGNYCPKSFVPLFAHSGSPREATTKYLEAQGAEHCSTPTIWFPWMAGVASLLFCSSELTTSSDHPPCSSLSRKLGSSSTFFSNFVHQSWNAFKGTVSLPKLARKLNALPIILCASTLVVTRPPELEFRRIMVVDGPCCC